MPNKFLASLLTGLLVSTSAPALAQSVTHQRIDTFEDMTTTYRELSDGVCSYSIEYPGTYVIVAGHRRTADLVAGVTHRGQSSTWSTVEPTAHQSPLIRSHMSLINIASQVVLELCW